MVATHFSGNAIKIGVLRILKNPIFWKKWWNYFLPVFKAPQKWMLLFFWPLFFFVLLFSVSSASSKRVLKKTYFYRSFLHTLLKHLVTSCSNKEVKPKLPQKRCTFFFGNLFFDQKQLSKTLILHHPLKTVHKKSPKTPIFIGSKKGGQVIDPTVAKLLTLKWPKCGQVKEPN